MTNVRSLCVLCFGLGAVSMLFVCTMVAPAKREIHARETGIASQPSHFEALHPHGTIEAVHTNSQSATGQASFTENRVRAALNAILY